MICACLQFGGRAVVPLINAGLLLPSIAHLLAFWQPALRRFYAHLERLDPRLRYLLPSAMPRYIRIALFQAIRKGRIEINGPGLARLGKRLCDSGFDWPDVDTLVAAWLATLDELFADRFGAEVREEWVRFYGALRAQSAARTG
jgi:hypothetical protein